MNFQLLFLLIFTGFYISVLNGDLEENIYMCEHKIFCRGPILEKVAQLKLYDDSKDFVRLVLKYSEDKILQNFNDTFPHYAKSIEADQLRRFIDLNFLKPESELVEYEPNDWMPKPKTFSVIQKREYYQWALRLHNIWLKLSRKINVSVKNQPDRYSLIYVPYPFIIPGGRFQEYYYWDSYWILKGLLSSEMFLMAKYMILNFDHLIQRFGFIPNGGRVYYLARSQPPLFTMMVEEYLIATGDFDFVLRVLPQMESEIEFWLENRRKMVEFKEKSYLGFYYNVKSNVPRSESYREDIETADRFPEEKKQQLFRTIASTCESGWDFSSRFMTKETKLENLETTKILPVDLNAIMCANFRILANFFARAGNQTKAANYEKIYLKMMTTLKEVLYNEENGVWFDYNVRTKTHNTNFYPSNLSPLFTMCYGKDYVDFDRVYNYFTKAVGNYINRGIPTSFNKTGQQWDYPNAWPNLQHMLIEGLDKTGHFTLKNIAFKLASGWLHHNFKVFTKTGAMFEKYDVGASTVQAGSGGEYKVQTGFGWTNGVVLDLLRKYGHQLKNDNSINSSFSSLKMYFIVNLFFLLLNFHIIF